jgi:hypothetical protein
MREVAAVLVAALVFLGTMKLVRSVMDQSLPSNDSMGFTYCNNNQAVAWINVSVLGTVDEEGTIAHERKHMEQINRFDARCEIFEVWFIANRLEAEAEAFCEDVKIEMRPDFLYPLEREEAIEKYAKWLRTYRDPPLDKKDAIKLLEKFC